MVYPLHLRNKRMLMKMKVPCHKGLFISLVLLVFWTRFIPTYYKPDDDKI